MCAETDQDRRHRQEVLRQTDLLEATRDDKKYAIIKMLLLEWVEYLSNGWWLNRLAQNYFLSLP